MHKCNPGLNIEDEVQSAKLQVLFPQNFIPRENSCPYGNECALGFVLHVDVHIHVDLIYQ